MQRVVRSTGYVYWGHLVDKDWRKKALELHDAAVSRDPAQLRSLQEAGLIRGFTEYETLSTPLIECIRSFFDTGLDQRPNLFEMVRILLENGANPFARFGQDGSYYFYGGVMNVATESGDIDLIRFILSSAFGDMDSVKAWRPDDFEKKTRRMEKKIDFINQKGRDGETPLHTALENNSIREGHSTDIIDFLIENDANVSAVDNNHRTPLFWCQSQRYSGIIDLLIENGANVNAVDDIGETPLYQNAQCLPVIKQLCHHGAHVNVKTNYGETPLHEAARNPPQSGVESSIQFLIFNGADIEAVDHWGQTPISKAVQCKFFESVKELVHAGANLFTKDREGRSILHLAVTSESITRFLIEHKADVNAIDNRGKTPLIVAADCRTLPSAMLLWEEGADLDAEDDNGNSAYDICTRAYTRTFVPVNPVRQVVEAENCRRRNEAFAMATDRRLGSDSRAHVFSLDEIRMILTGNFM